MEIHQVLVSASPGDAITNYAFEVRALLRRIGPSEIFARYYDQRLVHEVQPLERFERRRRQRPEHDMLLFHASIGEPEVRAFLEERPERLVLMYHNISPPEFFRPYDPAFSGLLEAGRNDLAALRNRVSMAIAVSEYNARELRDLGYRNVKVAPLVVDTERLHREPGDPDTTHHLTEGVTGPVVLFVGQLMPHKRPDMVIKAYHALVTHLVPDAHLMMVGAARLERYREALQLFIHELNLGKAWLTGSVSDAQLVSFYRRADVFVTASEHEGFCVPLLEAMSFDIPVIARGCAAVPETVGDAGLLLPPDASPLVMAEAMATVIGDAEVRAGLIERAHERLQLFDPDRARGTVLEHLLEMA